MNYHGTMFWDNAISMHACVKPNKLVTCRNQNSVGKSKNRFGSKKHRFGTNKNGTCDVFVTQIRIHKGYYVDTHVMQSQFNEYNGID